MSVIQNEMQACELALNRHRSWRVEAGQALSGAPVLQHDFHFPTDATQTERDRRFWLAARWAITGPDNALPRRPKRQDERAPL